MATTTLSSREFNQNASQAKKAAADGPVFITDRGQPAHVLLSIADYRRLTGERRKIADMLAMPRDVDIDFDPPKLVIHSRPPDLD
jgi:prevent-host-death family protein